MKRGEGEEGGVDVGRVRRRGERWAVGCWWCVESHWIEDVVLKGDSDCTFLLHLLV